MLGNFDELKAQIFLKPCPFCGGEAKIEELESRIDRFRAVIKCQRCGANIDWSQDFSHSTKRTPTGVAIKTVRIPASISPFNAWNRRVMTLEIEGQKGKKGPKSVVEELRNKKSTYNLKLFDRAADMIETLTAVNRLLERDIADRDEMLKKKVEEVYPEFMRDYKAMEQELDDLYKELAEIEEDIKNNEKD